MADSVLSTRRDRTTANCPLTFRLVLSEYVKYIAAGVRVRLADLGIDLSLEAADQPPGAPPQRPATAQAN